MKLILIPHNLTLTKAIEDHVVARIDKLDHLDQRIVDARVTLEQDHTRVPEKQFMCSIRLGVRGRDLFAKDVESDLYSAIDVVTKKIEQQTFRDVLSGQTIIAEQRDTGLFLAANKIFSHSPVALLFAESAG